MTYQDQKLRAIGRLTIAAIATTFLLSLSLIYPEPTQNIVRHLPISRNGNEYGVWLGVLATLAPIFWAVNFGLIFTSPEQEVRFVQWSKRWRKTTIEFEEKEFDTASPDYRKTAWRYFIDRRQG